MIRRLIADQEGQSLVEYSLIAAALVLGIYVAASGLLQIQAGVFKNQAHALHVWRAP